MSQKLCIINVDFFERPVIAYISTIVSFHDLSNKKIGAGICVQDISLHAKQNECTLH